MLAMIPGEYCHKQGIESAMSELGEKMLAHGPRNWMSRNFVELDMPWARFWQGLLRFMHGVLPEATSETLMKTVASRSRVITAIYTDRKRVLSLLEDIQADWLERNRDKGYPISIVLSGLFDDIHKCCKQAGLREHTYLQSIGYYGRTDRLPNERELELITMCGHGLISVARVQDLVLKTRQKAITPKEAAEEIARPCVCGIVNQDRAERIFRHLALSRNAK